MIGPALHANYQLRVLDLHEPEYAVDDLVTASVLDFDALVRACTGVEVVVYLAMGPKDKENWAAPEVEKGQFDVNVTGLYLSLRAAAQAGVHRVVLTSSMSVFDEHPSSEPGRHARTNATDAYGLSKRLGEDVCAAAVSEYGISATALRLSLPMSDEEYLAQPDPTRQAKCTAATDVVAAFTAAVHRRGEGFTPVQIAGDPAGRFHDLAPARELLGWEPQIVPGRAGDA